VKHFSPGVPYAVYCGEQGFLVSLFPGRVIGGRSKRLEILKELKQGFSFDSIK
jgi:hypothetical protein